MWLSFGGKNGLSCWVHLRQLFDGVARSVAFICWCISTIIALVLSQHTVLFSGANTTLKNIDKKVFVIHFLICQKKKAFNIRRVLLYNLKSMSFMRLQKLQDNSFFRILSWNLRKLYIFVNMQESLPLSSGLIALFFVRHLYMVWSLW